MDGHVGEDETITEIGTTNVGKVLKIELGIEAVVVAGNEDLAAIKSVHHAQASVGKRYVSEDIHRISPMHPLVPSLFQVLLHFLQAGIRAQWGTVRCGEGEDLRVVYVDV